MQQFEFAAKLGVDPTKIDGCEFGSGSCGLAETTQGARAKRSRLVARSPVKRRETNVKLGSTKRFDCLLERFLTRLKPDYASRPNNPQLGMREKSAHLILSAKHGRIPWFLLEALLHPGNS